MNLKALAIMIFGNEAISGQRFNRISNQDWQMIIIAVICFGIGLYIYLKNRNKWPVGGRAGKSAAQLKRELKQLVLHDEAVANRLIAAERSLRPKFAEKDLIQLAIDRLIRDRR